MARVWHAAANFAEEWLQCEAFHHLLLSVAYIQYEPVLDSGDDGDGLVADDYGLTAADAEIELRPPAEPDAVDDAEAGWAGRDGAGRGQLLSRTREHRRDR